METFIRAHIERLPAGVRVIYGEVMPRFMDSGRSLPIEGRTHRLLRRGLIEVLGRDSRYLEWMAVASLLRKTRPQVVLAEYGLTGVAVMKACKKTGIPLVVHFHGYDAYMNHVLESYRSAYKELFEYAGAVIAVSEDMMQQLASLGADRDRLHLNPYGVDMEQFTPTDPSAAAPWYIAAGRFVDKKAPHLTLMAFHRVAQEVPGARLIMLGDGPLRDACYQLAKSLRMLSSVEFRGAVSHQQVVDAMKVSRAFVQHSLRPSNGDSEGTPVAVLEAGASGLPVVATRHAGIKDAVVENETGFLVDECDVDRMADKMMLLARDPDLARKMGEAGRERVRSRYSIDISIGNLRRIVESVTSRR